MLDDDDGVQALTNFASRCFKLEHVLFYLDCEQFRNFDGTFEDLKGYVGLISLYPVLPSVFLTIYPSLG